MSERPYRRAYALLRRVESLRPGLGAELRELLERLRQPPQEPQLVAPGVVVLPWVFAFYFETPYGQDDEG